MSTLLLGTEKLTKFKLDPYTEMVIMNNNFEPWKGGDDVIEFTEITLNVADTVKVVVHVTDDAMTDGNFNAIDIVVYSGRIEPAEVIEILKRSHEELLMAYSYKINNPKSNTEKLFK